MSRCRLGSVRIKSKLLQIVGKHSIAEHSFRLLKKIGEKFDVDIAAAICPDEKPLVDLANDVGIPIFERTRQSAEGETDQEIYNGWNEKLKGYERFIWINPCMVFLKLETCGLAIDAMRGSSESMTSVYKNRGPIWDVDKKMIYGYAKGGMNTKTNDVYYLPAHCFFGYRTEILGTDEMTKGYGTFIELKRSAEFLDIDTPEDLVIARSFATQNNDSLI